MKENPDYTHLDALIKARIAAGNNTFMLIDGGMVYLEAKYLSEITGRQALRIIDGRLQALRKKGVISYSTADKWTVSHE